MKLKMSKLKIIGLMFVLINLFAVIQVRAQTVQLDYAGVNIFNPMEQHNKRVLTNGIALLKDYEVSVSRGRTSHSIGSSNTTITDGYQMEIIYDYRKYKEAMNGYTNMEFQINTYTNFYFAGVNKFVVVRYSIWGDGSMHLFVNYAGSSFLITQIPLDSDLIIISIQYFMAWFVSQNRNYGIVKSYIYHKNYTDTNATFLQGLSYATMGLWSAGNCYINSEEYSFYYNNIDSWEGGQTKIVKNSWIKAYRAIYLTQNDLESFPAIPRIDLESLDGPSIDFTKPPTSTYWEYQSFNLETVSNRTTEFKQSYTVYNETANATEEKSFDYTYTFGVLAVISKTNQYYYSTQTIAPESWGSWTINVLNWGWLGVYRIDFNWLRNFFVWTVNAIIFLFQAILFLLIIAFNYLIVWLSLQIIVLIWNYPIYWISLAAVAIIFYIIYFIIWLWNQAILLWKMIIEPLITWFYENVLLPAWNWIVSLFIAFIEWLRNDGLKQIIQLYLFIVAFGITVIIFVLSLGAIDFNTVWFSITELLWQINEIIFTFNTMFFGNIVLLIKYSFAYILLIGLIYIKYIYNKARGNIQRASRLQSMINAYKLPLVLTVRLVQYVIGFIQGGVPTDGAEN